MDHKNVTLERGTCITMDMTVIFVTRIKSEINSTLT